MSTRYASASDQWTTDGIRRAATAAAARQRGKSDCGHKVSLPRVSAELGKILAQGNAISWTDADGREMRAQIWSPAQYAHSYWMLVDPRCAHFPGEMRMATADADGHLSLEARVYNARGEHRIHAWDGSPCYGGQNGADGRWTPCGGCLAQRVRELTGLHVKVSVPGAEFGLTVRWGTLREVSGDVAIFDGYCDSSGIREYNGRSYSGDGVHVPLASIREIAADGPAVSQPEPATEVAAPAPETSPAARSFMSDASRTARRSKPRTARWEAGQAMPLGTPGRRPYVGERCKVGSHDGCKYPPGGCACPCHKTKPAPATARRTAPAAKSSSSELTDAALVAILARFDVPASAGLTRAAASAVYRELGISPRVHGRLTAHGWLAREGDARWLTEAGRARLTAGAS